MDWFDDWALTLAVFIPLVGLAVILALPKAKELWIKVAALETGMNGTFVAQDLILFFIFFEIVLLPMFFMIGVWGGPRREYASIKFFLFTLFGSALMLVSFLAIFFLSKQ